MWNRFSLTFIWWMSRRDSQDFYLKIQFLEYGRRYIWDFFYSTRDRLHETSNECDWRWETKLSNMKFVWGTFFLKICVDWQRESESSIAMRKKELKIKVEMNNYKIWIGNELASFSKKKLKWLTICSQNDNWISFWL